MGFLVSSGFSLLTLVQKSALVKQKNNSHSCDSIPTNISDTRTLRLNYSCRNIGKSSFKHDVILDNL